MKISTRIKFLIPLLLIFIITLSLLYTYASFYDGVFRLKKDEVNNLLSKTKSPCEKLYECNIQPGDILIRKYSTRRVWFVEKAVDIYFTHSAIYLGDDELFEAIGPETNSKDDIQVHTLTESDWFDDGVTDFVIVRPKQYKGKFEVAKESFKRIAEDNRYRFGLSFQGSYYVMCADVLMNEFLRLNILAPKVIPKTITPDYLVWLGAKSAKDFEVVGQHISN